MVSGYGSETTTIRFTMQQVKSVRVIACFLGEITTETDITETPVCHMIYDELTL